MASMNIEEIWAAYRSKLKAFIRSRVADEDEVEDLLQEVMIRTHEGLGTVKSETSIKTWVFQIANNAIIDFYRKSGRAKDLQADDLWYGEKEGAQFSLSRYPKVRASRETCLIQALQGSRYRKTFN